MGNLYVGEVETFGSCNEKTGSDYLERYIFAESREEAERKMLDFVEKLNLELHDDYDCLVAREAKSANQDSIFLAKKYNKEG